MRVRIAEFVSILTSPLHRPPRKETSNECSTGMESFFSIAPVVLFAMAVTTFLRIWRDVEQHFPLHNYKVFSRQFDNKNSYRRPAADKTVVRVWEIHRTLFPKSYKRALFVTLLLAATLLMLSYPLWLVLP